MTSTSQSADTSLIKIGIINYPGAMLSAVQGLREIFLLANRICAQNGFEREFEVILLTPEDIAGGGYEDHRLQVLIMTPCLEGKYHLQPDAHLNRWMQQHHSQGAVVCSVCAGAFLLAASGILDGRPATTHWDLAERFATDYPRVKLDINKILINDGDIITAGGLMAWMDLGLELVAQFTQPQIMRQLGKYLIIDTGAREQRYYQSFNPKLDHGDRLVLKTQHHLQACFHEHISISDLPDMVHLSERTFLRRFVKATGLKPMQYLQRLRIQKACDLLEASADTIEAIAEQVGYEDTSAFRKIFIKTTGLTPKEFRGRFS